MSSGPSRRAPARRVPLACTSPARAARRARSAAGVTVTPRFGSRAPASPTPTVHAIGATWARASSALCARGGRTSWAARVNPVWSAIPTRRPSSSARTSPTRRAPATRATRATGWRARLVGRDTTTTSSIARVSPAWRATPRWAGAPCANATCASPGRTRLDWRRPCAPSASLARIPTTATGTPPARSAPWGATPTTPIRATCASSATRAPTPTPRA